MNFDSIEDIKISNNFGGVLYDLKININFSSPTTFEASFLSENGTYLIDENSLNSESPLKLTMSGLSVNVYPVMYKITQAPAGKLLLVKFTDASVKFLDKYLISIENAPADERIIRLIKTISRDAQLDQLKYTPFEFVEALKNKGIPMKQSVYNLLAKYKKGNLEPDGENFSLKYVDLDASGGLRSVLQSVASKLGIIFYWNVFSGGDGRLEFFNVREGFSSKEAKALVAKVKQDYEAKISSQDISYSIEDNESLSDLAYNVSETQTSPTKKNVSFKYIDGGFKEDDLLKNIALAASVSEEFFEKYCKWNLSALFFSDKEMYNWRDLRGMSSNGIFTEWDVFDVAVDAEDSVIFGEKPLINPLVKSYLGVSNESSGLIYKFDGTTRGYLKDFLTRLLENGFSTQAGAISENDLYFYENLIYKGINKKNLSHSDLGVTPNDKILIEPHFCSAIFPAFTYDQIRRELLVFLKYTTQVLISRSVERKFLSEYEIGHQNPYSINWYYEHENVDETPFADLKNHYILLIKRKGYNVENIGTQVGLKSFIEKIGGFSEKIEIGAKDFTLEINSLVTLFKQNTVKAPLKENNNNKGYLILEKQKLSVPVKSDLTLYKKDGSAISQNFWGVNELKNYHYLIKGPNIKESVGFIEKNFEQKSYANYKWAYNGSNLKNKFTVSNLLDVTQIPSFGTIEREDGDTVKVLYNSDYYSEIVKKFKLINPQEPSYAFSCSIEALVIPEADWISLGLESISINYGGENGVSSSLTIGTKKKQSEASDMLENILDQNVSFGGTNKLSPKPFWSKFPAKMSGAMFK